MFQPQPPEMPDGPDLRNSSPDTSNAQTSTSTPVTNGEAPSMPLSAPQGPPLQVPQAVLAEISRTPPRSIVQVLAYQLLHEGEFRYIRNGPKFSVLDAVELINPVLLPGRVPIQARTVFNMREIQEFNLIRSGSGRKPLQVYEKKRKPELDPDQPVQLHLNTFVVSSAQQLKTLATIIYDVDVCGVSLEGENVCRHGKVSWILISAKKTLVPIDVIALSQEAPTVWDTLKKCIFENKKLVKIFHDCRPAADYLFHKHGIKLINVFDTQVADAFIVRNTTGFHPSELRSLPNVLQLYNARIPSEELDYIRKCDQLEDKENSPWMVRPLPDRAHLKYGALKVKHLVPLRDNEIKKLLEKFTRAVSSQSEAYNQSDSLYQAQAENPLALPEALETILDEDMVESG